MTMHTTPPQLRDELIGAIGGHQQRRRRRQVVLSGAALVLVIGLGAVLVDRNQDAPTEVVPASTTSTSVSTTTTATTTTAPAAERDVVTFPATDTPSLVVAVSVNRGGLAVANLEQGVTHVYPSASTTLFGGGALDNASIGDEYLHIYVPGFAPVPGRIFTIPARLDDIDRALIDQPPGPVEIEGADAAGRVVPISGGRAWVMGARSDRPSLPLHMLEADGSVSDVAVVDAHVIVEVVGDDAVLWALNEEFEISGWLLVTPDGRVTELEPPSDGGVVAGSSAYLVWGARGYGGSTAAGEEIFIVDRASGARLEVPAPPGYWWAANLSEPTIPSNSPRWSAIDPTGTRALLGLWPTDDQQLEEFIPTIVDLATGEVTRRPVPDGTRVSATQWSSDGRSIIVVATRDVEPSTRQNSVLRIDVETGEVTDLGDVFPPGYHVVAVR